MHGFFLHLKEFISTTRKHFYKTLTYVQLKLRYLHYIDYYTLLIQKQLLTTRRNILKQNCYTTMTQAKQNKKDTGGALYSLSIRNQYLYVFI